MKILNLYCGLGGNRRGWPPGDYVTAVDIDPGVLGEYEKAFPQDQCVLDDAHEFLRLNFREYDAIWSSPPCQSHSRMSRVNYGRHAFTAYPDFRLYEEVVFLQANCEAPWIVENVVPFYRMPIRGEIRGRHVFWSNKYVPQFTVKGLDPTVCTRRELAKELGFDYEGNIYQGSNDPLKVMRNCVHPEIGRIIYEEVFVDSSVDLADGYDQRMFSY